MRDNDIRDAFEAIAASDGLKQKALSAALKAAKQEKKKPRLIIAMAAVAAIFVLAIGGYGMYMQPTAYISVDVNPSIELALNRTNNVVDARAYNPDGENILAGVDLKGRSYEDAIDAIMDKEREAGYLGDKAYVVFAVQSNNPAQEQDLMQATQVCVDSHHGSTQTEYVSVSEETREEAHQHGMSAGKYQTFLELQKVDPTVTIEDSHHMSMHDMKNRIDECSKDHEVEKHQAEDHETEDNKTHDQENRHHGQD